MISAQDELTSLEIMKYDLLSLGSAVVDKIVCVDDSFIEEMALEKGGTRNYLNKSHDTFLEKLSDKKILNVPGGSAGNATKVVAGLGKRCAYIAKIGNDPLGVFYKKAFLQRQIEPLFSISQDLPTGSVFSFVTPDGERTICPDLRACQTIGQNDIPVEQFKHARLFHMDGYNFFYPEANEQALKAAQQANCTISLDFSSYEIVRAQFDLLTKLLEDGTFDILFANEREAFEMTGRSDPIEACKTLSKYANYATVMMGENGSVTSFEEKLYFQYTDPVRPVDTTGAGDMFVGGFLYAFLEGLDVEACMRYGKTTAAEGVQVFGGELSPDHLQRLQKQLASLELANY